MEKAIVKLSKEDLKATLIGAPIGSSDAAITVSLYDESQGRVTAYDGEFRVSYSSERNQYGDIEVDVINLYGLDDWFYDDDTGDVVVDEESVDFFIEEGRWYRKISDAIEEALTKDYMMSGNAFDRVVVKWKR